MKVALFVPFIPDENTTPALGPLYIISLLEQIEIEAYLFDERIDKNALNKLLKFNPEIVGISTVTANYPAGLNAANVIKKIFPKVPIVFGGPHPSILPMDVIKEKYVDYVITGEGEYPFKQLVEFLKNKSIEKLKEIKNLLFKSDAKIIVNEKSVFLSSEELDKLPFPAFHKMDIEAYFSSTQAHGLFRKGKRVLPIMTTRGCPQDCTFCCRVMGDKLRTRSVESVIAEIKSLVEKYKIDEVYIEDDNFTVNKKRAIEILNRLSEIFPGMYVKFANGIRADFVDEELLSTMKKAGVYSLSFGIESGAKATLEKMKKNLNLMKAKENIMLAKSMGFYVGSNCIIGYPGETVVDIEESIAFFQSLNLDSMAIVNLVPFPGTQVREECIKHGYLTKEADDWKNYYFSIKRPIPLVESKAVSKEKMIELSNKAYRKMYLRPQWILRNIRNLSIGQIFNGFAAMINKFGKGQ